MAKRIMAKDRRRKKQGKSEIQETEKPSGAREGVGCRNATWRVAPLEAVKWAGHRM